MAAKFTHTSFQKLRGSRLVAIWLAAITASFLAAYLLLRIASFLIGLLL